MLRVARTSVCMIDDCTSCAFGCCEPGLTHVCAFLLEQDYVPPPSVLYPKPSAPVSPLTRSGPYGDARCTNTPWLPLDQYCRWCQRKGGSNSRCDLQHWVLNVPRAEALEWRKKKREAEALLAQPNRGKRPKRQSSTVSMARESM